MDNVVSETGDAQAAKANKTLGFICYALYLPAP